MEREKLGSVDSASGRDTRPGPGPVETRSFDRISPRHGFRGNARFQIEHVLGAGGMGVVYQVYDRERNARVALKTLVAADGYGVQRFKNEFRALANVEHENLVRLGELFHENDQWFFTMELLTGRTFIEYARTLPKRDPASGAPAVGYDETRLRAGLRQLVAGLCALHAANLVHRDVKPSNLLVTASGRVVLLDFGLVVHTQQPESAMTVVGTAMYMAPEQALFQAVGPAADWYSVGVVLYEALTGEAPFCGTLLEIIQRKQAMDGPAPSEKVAGVPTDLDQLCVEMLRSDPARRPSGAEIAQRLGIAPPEPRSEPHAAATFVGRAHELSILERAFRDACLERRPVTVCIHGESGLGKTALVRSFLDKLRTAATGAVLLRGRCYERESMPYKAFDGVVDALTRHVSRLDSSFAAALLPKDAEALACLFPGMRQIPVMAPLPDPVMPDRQELRARAFAALRELLARLCDRQPVVLSIDDFQWADADSLLLLEDLVRGPEPPPIFLVITLRVGASTATAIAGLPGDVRHIELGPLQSLDAQALARMLLPASQDRETQAEALAHEAEGHPLFLQELVRYVSEATAPQPSGVRLDEALWTRIERLSAPPRAILEMLAVAGAPIRESTAARAAGLTPEQFAAAARVLRNAQLLRSSGPLRSDTVEPYHDRVREAVLGRLSEPVRIAHHRRLAEALDAGGPENPEALVRHLLAAGESQRAAAHAERAARHADGVLAFDRAVTLYRSALQLRSEADVTTPATVERLRRALADALVNAGRGAEAAQEYQAAATVADPVTAIDLRRLAFEQLLVSGHIEEGLAAAGAVLSSVGLKLPTSPRAALWSLLRARARLKVRGFRYRARSENELPADERVRIDACWSASIGLAVVDFIRGADFATRQLLFALDAGEPYRIARALANEACFSATGGGKTERRSAQLVTQALLAADQVHTPKAQALASFAAGSVALLEGRWRKARVHLEAADRDYRERCAGLTGELDAVDVDLVVALAYLGEIKDLRRCVREYLHHAEERGDLYAATLLRTGEANLAWLAVDDAAAARKQADEARRGYSPKAVIVQAYLDLIAQVRIELYEGNAALAWSCVQERAPVFKKALLHKVQLLRIVMTTLRGTTAVAAATSDVPCGATTKAELQTEVAAAVRVLRGEGNGWAAGVAALLDAELHVLRGEPAAAAIRYARAVIALENNDMALHAACARWRQGELVGGGAGASLIGRAQAFMDGQAIARPERFRRLVTPTAPLR